MSQCPNCGNKLTCGCQRRTASNGASVCRGCLSGYEAKLKNQTTPTTVTTNTVWGKDRYKNLNKFVK